MVHNKYPMRITSFLALSSRMAVSLSLISLLADVGPATFVCWELSCHSKHQCHIHQYPRLIMTTIQNCCSLCWHLIQALHHNHLESASFFLAATSADEQHPQDAETHPSSRVVIGFQVTGCFTQRQAKPWCNQSLN